MDQAKLAEFEAASEALFTSPNPAEQARAQALVVQLGDSVEHIPQCQFILENSTSNYALHVAATNLKRLITDHWNNFTVDDRIGIQRYVLQFLGDKGHRVENFVTTALISLLCRITKLGWYDEGYQLRGIVEETMKFLEHSQAHCIVGLKILNQLVDEMNSRVARRTLTQQRRITVNFRDKALLNIFEIALGILNQLASCELSIDDPALADSYADEAFGLVTKCLTYDFIGTNPDESSEEIGTLQIPSTWRDTILSPQTMALFFRLYRGKVTGAVPPEEAFVPPAGMMDADEMSIAGGGRMLDPATAPPIGQMQVSAERAAQALECLTLLVSVRRSIFGPDSVRKQFLVNLIRGICDILANETGFTDNECYHQFCRLLGRLKASYQLSELVRADGYSRWIELSAEFAIKSFGQMDWASNSIHYILGLWSRMVAAAPYVRIDPRAGHDPQLDEYAPKVVEAYVKARLDMVEPALRGEIDDDFEDPERVEEQVEQLPGVFRYSYEASKITLLRILDPLLQRYNEVLALARADPSEALMQQIELIEVQLAWLVYIVGALIGGQLFGSSSTRQGDELIDADLSRRVLQLMSNVDMRLASSDGRSKCSVRLELAMLYYIRNFRKTYVSEQHGMPNPQADGGSDAVPRTTRQQLFKSMFDRLGMGDHFVVVTQIVQKIANNLRFWIDRNDILKQTLEMFWELSFTYSSAKLLLSLDTVNYLLSHHTEKFFPFLGVPANTRFRTMFYTALARLMFLDETGELFGPFIQPILEHMDEIGPHCGEKSERVMVALIGLFRDLRGIAAATHTRRTYTMLFEALYPKYFDLFASAAEAWADTPAVMHPLLKFMAEMVYNKSQRVNFDNCSPNGILLFRETSRLLCAYGNQALASPPGDDPYTSKFKGMGVALRMLTRALDGNYVNLGVFALYEDPALENAIGVAVKMVLAVPVDQLMQLPKAALPYFYFLNVMFRSHLADMCRLAPPMFLQVMTALQEGLDALSVNISSHAAAAIDHIASYYVKNYRKETSDSEGLKAHIQEQPNIFSTFTGLIFQILVFGEVKNQWTLARTLLATILAGQLVQPTAFDEFKQNVIMSQPEEVQEPLAVAFEALMKDVSPTLEATNRERFTQHMTTFRAEVQRFIHS